MSSSSTSSEEPSATAQEAVVDEAWNAADADKILRATEEIIGQNNKIACLYRVHRGKLAAVSTFFADMFEAASGKDTPEMDGLPVLNLQESLYVVSMLLGAAYNDLKEFADLDTHLTSGQVNWKVVFDIYEAANKYGLYVLRSYGQALLVYVSI